MGPSIKKVYFEYSDGTMAVLEGEDVVKWEVLFARTGKTGFEGITWKPLTKPVTLKPKVRK